jgi:high-affinity nickel permease
MAKADASSRESRKARRAGNEFGTINAHMIGVFSIIALGFFLGMRHATDPDHVIAVTTTVARHLNHAWRLALTGQGARIMVP